MCLSGGLPVAFGASLSAVTPDELNDPTIETVKTPGIVSMEPDPAFQNASKHSKPQQRSHSSTKKPSNPDVSASSMPSDFTETFTSAPQTFTKSSTTKTVQRTVFKDGVKVEESEEHVDSENPDRNYFFSTNGDSFPRSTDPKATTFIELPDSPSSPVLQSHPHNQIGHFHSSSNQISPRSHFELSTFPSNDHSFSSERFPSDTQTFTRRIVSAKRTVTVNGKEVLQADAHYDSDHPEKAYVVSTSGGSTPPPSSKAITDGTSPTQGGLPRIEPSSGKPIVSRSYWTLFVFVLLIVL